MGLTRTPEIAEAVEKNRNQIEQNLRFLKKLLQSGEKVTIRIIVTKKAVAMDPNIEIMVDSSVISGSDRFDLDRKKGG